MGGHINTDDLGVILLSDTTLGYIVTLHKPNILRIRKWVGLALPQPTAAWGLVKVFKGALEIEAVYTLEHVEDAWVLPMNGLCKLAKEFYNKWLSEE